MWGLSTGKAQGESFNDELILLLIPSDKCTHVRVETGKEATGCVVGVTKTQSQDSSIFDDPRQSEIGGEVQDNDTQEEGL